MIEPGDNPWKIAASCVGDGRRWKELVDANPQKQRSDATGNFVSLMPGEVLRLPGDWIAKMGGVPLVPVVAPGSEVGSLHDAGSFRGSSPPKLAPMKDAGALLPYGFSDSDMQIVSGLARMWGASPDDLIVTWFEESGLQPHQMTDVGSSTAPDGRPKLWYGGLIGGLAEQWNGKLGRRVYVIDETHGWVPGTWEKIVTKMPIAVQLQAIAQIWDRQFKTRIPGGLTLGGFAEKMGVTPAAVIHAINFLPAYMSKIQTADSAIVKPGDPSGGYEGNAGPRFPDWGLDVNKDGAISLRDLDAHGRKKLAVLEQTASGKALLAAAREVGTGSLATLFAPIANEWRDLSGKNPIVTVGWGGEGPMGPGERGAGLVETVAVLAAIAAAAYYGWPYVQKLLRKG